MSDNPLDNIGQPNPAPAPQEDLLPKTKINDEKCAEFNFKVSWKNGEDDRGPDFIGVKCKKEVRDYVYPEQINPTIENIKNYIINPPDGHVVEKGWLQSLPDNLDNISITEITISAPVETDCPAENEDGKPLELVNPEAGDGGQPEPKPEEIVGFEISTGSDNCDPKTIPINISYSSNKIQFFLHNILTTIKKSLFSENGKIKRLVFYLPLDVRSNLDPNGNILPIKGIDGNFNTIPTAPGSFSDIYTSQPIMQALLKRSGDNSALGLYFAFIGGPNEVYLLVPESDAFPELNVDIIWSMIVNFGIKIKLNSKIKYVCDGEKNEKTIANKPINIKANDINLNLKYKYATSIVPYIPQDLPPVEVAPGQFLNINGNKIRHTGLIGATEGNFLYIFKPLIKQCPGCEGSGKVIINIKNPRTKQIEEKEINCRVCKGNPNNKITITEPTIFNMLLSSNIIEEDQDENSIFLYEDNKIIWNTKKLNFLIKKEIQQKIEETLAALNDINKKRSDEGKCPCCIKSFDTTFDVDFDTINSTDIRVNTEQDGILGSTIDSKEKQEGREKFPPPQQLGRPQPERAR